MIPRFASMAAINRGWPEFEWDEWAVDSYFTEIDPSVLTRATALTPNANFALCCACGYWIADRFKALDPSGEAGDFLELAAASSYGAPQFEYFELDQSAWHGPVRGPQAVMITIVIDALYCLADDPEPATRTAYLHALANHVIEPAEVFNQWFNAALDRLETHYRQRVALVPESILGLIDGDRWGEPVPQTAFDLAIPYQPQSAARSFAADIARINQNNPFLTRD